MKKLLVTGGLGFIGSNFVNMVAPMWDTVHIFDKKTYAGLQRNIVPDLKGVSFQLGDVCNISPLNMDGYDCVVHFAAETHVDNSIEGPEIFARTNMYGTAKVLEAARIASVPLTVIISTDEVYGSIAEGQATEDAAFSPSSPYSASKAGADLMAQAYAITYGMPIIIVRPTNNYGPRAHTEKLIPLLISRIKKSLSFPIYGDGKNKRNWLYVEDCCRAIHFLIKRKALGTWNIVGNSEMDNIEVCTRLWRALEEKGKVPLGWTKPPIEFVTDRKGHDYRYGVDGTKLYSIGWQPSVDFDTGIRRTVDWYYGE